MEGNFSIHFLPRADIGIEESLQKLGVLLFLDTSADVGSSLF